MLPRCFQECLAANCLGSDAAVLHLARGQPGLGAGGGGGRPELRRGGLSVFLTDWNQRLFNAAQDLNRARFLHELMVFPFVVAGLIAAYTVEDYCGRILRLRWRAWLTAKCVSLWMKDQSYYRLRFNEAGTDNPDQRISEDVATFVDRTFVLLTNLLSSVIGLTSFIAILWRISGKTLRCGCPIWGRCRCRA